MAVLDQKQVINYIKENKTISQHITDARDYSTLLRALIKGENHKELIVKIDNIKTDSKAEARKNYTYSIKDVFSRLSNNTSNVWSATGGSKVYSIENEDEKKKFIKSITNVRGGQSIEEWNKNNWMPVYHYDPAGVTFLEYDTSKGINPFPTNKPISCIRNYIPNGVNVEVILFEPETIKTESGSYKEWRLVDDLHDWIVRQDGDTYTIDKEATFEHPFGTVPALINSDITDPDSGKRLSPYDDVIELAEEYLRDKSIKTIFKFTQGFPLFWRYVTYCSECSGTGRKGTESCGTCSGHGVVKRRDVTDTVNLPVPTKEDPVINPIAGFITPPIEILDKFNSELDILEKVIELTIWGALVEGEKSNTATGRILDVQPIIQTLDSYSTPAEKREHLLTEMLANYYFITKDKNEQISSISYGRMYSILSSNQAIEMYHKSKEKGDNNVALDALWLQVLLAFYKNDPVSLRINTVKSGVEPFLHNTLEQIQDIFGREAAQKKVMFNKWWNNVIIGDKRIEDLTEDFNKWFEEQKPKEEVNNNQTNINEK